MTSPEAITVARLTDRELHAAGYPWADRARHDALDALAIHTERLQDDIKRLRTVPCACPCHDVAGHADEPTMGMMLADATRENEQLRKRAERAEADWRLLNAQYGDACTQYESILVGLKAEVKRLQAHIASMAPLLAIHGMGGYTMGEFVPTDPASVIHAEQLRDRAGRAERALDRVVKHFPAIGAWAQQVDAQAGTE